jgi:DNA-binding NarL/FixJ family response regulator
VSDEAGTQEPVTCVPIMVAGVWPAGVLEDVGAVPGTALIRLDADRRAPNPATIVDVIGRQRDPWLLIGSGTDDANAAGLVRDVRAVAPASRLAVLGPPENGARVSRWLLRGCNVYLLDDITAGQLLGVLGVVGPELVVVDRRCRQPRAEPAGVSRLTARERGILEMLCEGRGNNDMARALRLSRRTIELHLTNIFEKLGVASRTEAIVHAYHALS